MVASPAPFGFGLSPEDIARLMRQHGATDPRADMPADQVSPVSFLAEPRDAAGGFFIPPGVRAAAPAGDPSGPQPIDAGPGAPPALPSLAGAPAASGLGAPALTGRVAPEPQGLTALPPSFSFPDPVAARPAAGAPAPVATATPAPRGPAPAEADDAPGPMTVPLPPQRPLGLGAPSQADMPAVGAVPAQGQAPADTGIDWAGGLDRFRKNGGFDTLGAIGAGLLSAPTWAGGLAKGMTLDSEQQAKRSVTDLARAKFGVEQAKAARDVSALSGNAAILKRAYPTLSDAEAQAQASNGSTVTEALKILRDPNHGTGVPANYRMRGDGSGYEPIPGSEADPATISTNAKAREADKTLTVLDTPEKRAKAGISPNDTRTARMDPDGKVAFDSQPPAPTVHILEDENGNKHIRQYDPKTGAWIDPAQPAGAPPPATNPLALKGKTTGDQSKAAGFSDRMLNSERILSTNAGEGTSLKERTLNSIPIVGNYLTNDGFQSYDQAKRDFTNAQLRRESGAAIGKDEFASADKQYFPQPGDSEATIKQKTVNRRIAIEAMGREGGPTYLPSHVFDDAGALIPFEAGQRKAIPHVEGAGSQPPAATPGKIVQFRNQDEYTAAPSGTRFIAPDGKLRVKP